MNWKQTNKKNPHFSLPKKNLLKYNDTILRTDAAVFEAKCKFDVTFYMSFNFLIGVIVVCL